MNQSPFNLMPPLWLVAQGQQKLIAMINHVLQAEPEATRRLSQHSGKRVRVQWSPNVLGSTKNMTLETVLTPMGMFELIAPDDAVRDENITQLDLELKESSIANFLTKIKNKTKPDLHMQGDVNLATDINWVIANVRWDGLRDLERLTSPTVAAVVQKALELGKSFFQRKS